MRAKNLPTIDAGYWVAIVAASMCGTNTGDLAAGPLGLGHVRGMLPLALVFVAIVWAEKLLDWTTVAFYWMAIIVLRTMATNIADLVAHDLKVSYPLFLVGLAALMAGLIWFDRLRNGPTPQAANGEPRLPATDWNYWITMLAAGVFGTAMGDWLADNILPGFYWASLVGFPVFLAVLFVAYRFGLTKPWYWVAIATCRTWGTDLGDMLVGAFRTVTSKPAALWAASILTATLLTAIIVLWTRRSSVSVAVGDAQGQEAG